MGSEGHIASLSQAMEQMGLPLSAAHWKAGATWSVPLLSVTNRSLPITLVVKTSKKWI